MQPTEHWIIVPLPPFVDHLGDITTVHHLEEENISYDDDDNLGDDGNNHEDDDDIRDNDGGPQ